MVRALRLGVVGCGLAGSKLHGSGYKSLDEIELVACTDREKNYESKTVPFSEEFGVRAYRNVDELLTDDRIEAVDVCVMEPGHYEIALKALRAGKHVLCEKAMTDDLGKARELQALAKSLGLKFMVNYNYRYMDTVKDLKKRIDADEFGPLTFISIAGHGFTFHHSIDLMRHLGGEVIGVQGTYILDGKPLAYPLGEWVYTAPYAKAAIFRFENGGLGTITGSDTVANDFPLMSLTYAGVRGQVAYSDLVGDMDHIGDADSPFNKTFPQVLKDFADAVVNDTIPPVTARDGIHALELEDAIFNSHKHSTTVVPHLLIDEE